MRENINKKYNIWEKGNDLTKGAFKQLEEQVIKIIAWFRTKDEF